LKDAIDRGFSPRVPREDTLDILLLKAGRRQVHKSGISFLGGFYWHEEMALIIGDTVNIRFDPDHLGFLLVYSLDKKFLCRAGHTQRLKLDAGVSELREVAKRKRAARLRDAAVIEDLKWAAAGFDELERVACEEELDRNHGQAQKIAIAQGAPVTQILPDFDRDVRTGVSAPRIFTSEAERKFFSTDDTDDTD
jgi:hypothetical protein